jgi:hypothetical protein
MNKCYQQMYPHDQLRALDERTDMSIIVSVLNHANFQGLLPNLEHLERLITGGAKTLVRSCLDVDPKQRPLARQVTHVIRTNLAERPTLEIAGRANAAAHGNAIAHAH